jgi:xanthine dehydrogenase accessory factor
MPEDIFKEIVRLRSNSLRAALAIIIAHEGAAPRKDSVKMLISEDGHQMGNIGGGSVELEVCRMAREVMDTGKSKLLSFDLSHIDHDERALVCGGSMQIYLEPILPDPVLFIFGAGHVGKAVANAAVLIGFKIKVLDDRSRYATPERFPDAEVIFVEDWETVWERLEITSSSYIFIATQRPVSDRICLKHSARSSARYIGLLGSLKKTEILFDALEKEGIDRSKLGRVFVPAGLDIDSETPEEIAASIMPELIAARKNLNVRRLRDTLRCAKKEGET